MGKTTSRLALAATASIAALGMGAGNASAFYDPADGAIADTGTPFRLVTNPAVLEPGCFRAGQLGTPVASHVTVTGPPSEAHVTVLTGANFSVDQVLVPGVDRGYAVYKQFDTGSIGNDADIDPNQTATDMTAPGGAPVVPGGVIVCISDHQDASQNEPYIADGLPGEVAAINRPIIQPTIAALGVSALTSQNTYKVGFGYAVQRGYNPFWRQKFNNVGGDPLGQDTDGDGQFDATWIIPRPEQRGVRRYNDIDEFGESFNNGPEKAGYGQTVFFDVSGQGDPFAYLHKSLPGTVNGGPFASLIEANADQTDSSGLFTFSAQGDLPLSWAVKPSLAPESYGRKVTLTDDMLRAWHKQWQDYYAGKGPKPSLPLAPGTNSPAPDPSISVIVNLPERRPATGAPQAPVPVQRVAPPAAQPAAPASTSAAKKIKPKVLATRILRTKSGRRLQVFVRADDARVRIRIRMYTTKGRKVRDTTRMVATNRFTRVANLRVGANVKKVKASAAG